MLESLCGELFPKVFPIFLCDRGSEFSDPERIEHSRNAKPRAKVYFCDPLQSQQKPKCEKNHVEIRKVLPKGESDFDALSKPDMAVLMSHQPARRIEHRPDPRRGGDAEALSPLPCDSRKVKTMRAGLRVPHRIDAGISLARARLDSPQRFAFSLAITKIGV